MTHPLYTHWRLHPLMIALPLGLLVIACTYPSLALLAPRFIEWDENLSHGLLICALFVFFYCRPIAFTQSLNLPPALCWLGLLLSVMVWLTGALIPVDLLAQLAIVPLLFFALACSMGAAKAQGFAPAIGLLIFALPLWELLVPLLVVVAAKVVGASVGLLGIDVKLELTRLYLAAGSITITDDCSGVRYLTIALALGYVLCLLNHYRLRDCLLVMLIALLLGLVANWLRIIVIVLVGVESHLQSPLMHEHEYFGWLLFASLLLPALYFAPVSRRPRATFQFIPIKPLHLISVCMGLVVAACVYWTFALAALKVPAAPLQDQLPLAYAPLNKARMPLVIKTSEALGAQEFAQRQSTWVQLDQYQAPAGSLKLVPYLPRRPQSDSPRWQLQHTQIVTHQARDYLQLHWRTRDGDQAISWQWYQLGNFHSAQLWQAKLRQTQARAAGVTHFARVTITQLCSDNCTAAAAQLPSVAAHLNQSR